MTGLLTPAEVAKHCKVHPKTVVRAIMRGELRASRIATRGTWRIDPVDVDAWLDAKANRPREPRSHSRPITPRPVAMSPRSRPRRRSAGGRLELADL